MISNLLLLGLMNFGFPFKIVVKPYLYLIET